MGDNENMFCSGETWIMKKLKKIGIYGIIFILFIIVWQITSLLNFSIPPQVSELFYRDIDFISGNWFYISVVILQISCGLMMLGSYLFRQYKKRNAIDSRRLDTKNDLLSTP